MYRIARMMTPWRMKWYPIAVLVGFFLAVLLAVYGFRDGAIVSGRLGGDFPAFYSAGKLVAQGESQSIYDISRIKSVQQPLIPSGGYLPFANPPHFAYFYVPFGAMPYNIAYLVHFCVLVSLLTYVVHAFISLKYMHSSLLFFALLVCSAFYPLLISVVCGQNSVLSLFLLCIVWKFADSGREWLAGLCLGMLLYKPQFAIPFIGLFFLAGYWRVAVSGILTGVCTVLGTVFFLKHDLQNWLKFVFEFSADDAIRNKANAISLSGFSAAFNTGASSFSLSLAQIGSVLVVISISWLWYQGMRKKNLNELMAAACPAVLLIPQHVMFYDISLCVLSILLLIRDKTVRARVLPIVWLLGFSQLFSEWLGFSPLFFVVLFMYLYFFSFAWFRSQAVSLPLELTT